MVAESCHSENFRNMKEKKMFLKYIYQTKKKSYFHVKYLFVVAENCLNNNNKKLQQNNIKNYSISESNNNF